MQSIKAVLLCFSHRNVIGAGRLEGQTMFHASLYPLPGISRGKSGVEGQRLRY